MTPRQPIIGTMAFAPPPECATCGGLGVVMGPWRPPAPCPDCQLGSFRARRGGIPYSKDTPVRLPINATQFGPLYHPEQLRDAKGVLATGRPDWQETLEQSADLLEQYRTALVDLYVLLLGSQVEPKLSGTVVEQAAWIVAHRGLGIPAA